MHIPLYCRFPYFLNISLPFWVFYQLKEYLNKIKILRNIHEQTRVDFDKSTLVVLFEFNQRSNAKCWAKSSCFNVQVIKNKNKGKKLKSIPVVDDRAKREGVIL